MHFFGDVVVVELVCMCLVHLAVNGGSQVILCYMVLLMMNETVNTLLQDNLRECDAIKYIFRRLMHIFCCTLRFAFYTMFKDYTRERSAFHSEPG